MNEICFVRKCVLVVSFLWIAKVESGAFGPTLYYIHWNTSNPIFRIDNTDNIIDVNRNNIPFQYDQVNIICPTYPPGTREEDKEKYIIYNVSKEEYNSCRITNRNPRVIAVCDKPHQLMYFTVTFRSFTPTPGGLEFHPGRDYYFISTSSRSDMHRRVGGRCMTHNMKVIFKVHDPHSERYSYQLINERLRLSGRTKPWRRISSTTPSTTTTASTTTTRSRPKYYIPTFIYPKKKSVYKNHPNEVVKQEELRAVASSSSRTSLLPMTILFVVSLIFLS